MAPLPAAAVVTTILGDLPDIAALNQLVTPTARIVRDVIL
ncbi:hypothetical protein EV382_2843 [Micromonospora violae]|uniref:Uncharacterized protein n=1 Tax=Micromonospora violae TaxID=1278207 RepID=A0A4Q7UFM1_9ACTN|nr:hypothetical protein EV382_2843 [Micromonospora violae]